MKAWEWEYNAGWIIVLGVVIYAMITSKNIEDGPLVRYIIAGFGISIIGLRKGLREGNK